MSNGKQLLVINVLVAEYYHDCRIKGSIHVSNDKLAAYVEFLDREIPLVVYCASYICSASREAYKMLHKMGFKNLWAYEGGMNEWYHAGFPLEGACMKEYIATPIKRSEGEKSEVRDIGALELRNMMGDCGLC